MHGTRCFKCGGSGKIYTARGRAARVYLEGLRSKPVSELVPGDVIRYEGVPGISKGGWAKVTEIRMSTLVASINGVPVDASQLVDVMCEKYTLCGVSRDRVVRVAQSAEQKAETLARAIAYQATLTKKGQPRK